MKVILNQDIKGQGKKGQMVEVSDGYARNFLLPKNLAKEATKENINVMQGKQASAEHRLQVEKQEAEELREKLKDLVVVIKTKAGANGKLFGSVTSKEVAQELKMQHHIVLDKKKLVIPDGIKTLGVTEVEVKIYQGVSGKLRVNVVNE